MACEVELGEGYLPVQLLLALFIGRVGDAQGGELAHSERVNCSHRGAIGE